MCEWLSVKSNPTHGLPRWLQNAVNEGGPYTGCKLGRQTDHCRYGKDQIVQQDQVEITQPLQPAVVAEQVKVGDACITK